MLKAVIFDMDGTLLDSEIIHYIVIHEILKRELGYDQSMEEYMKYCGVPDHLMWPMILEELDASYYGRMAEMLDLPCVVFVRGKNPHQDAVKRAQELGIAALSTQYTMFETCGKLYTAGMKAVEIEDYDGDFVYD